MSAVAFLALASAFFLTAVCYSAVGFAGGSAYLALLVLFQAPQGFVAPLALSCNILVASVGSARYARAKLVRLRLLAPHAVFSMPCAYLGGRLALPPAAFDAVAAIGLGLAAWRLFCDRERLEEESILHPPPLWLAAAAGMGLGFLSGIIGIGGGIFLAPFLYKIKAGPPRVIAATCCWFILLNSLAGLAGQSVKISSAALLPYAPLFLAVTLGSILGQSFVLHRFTPRHLSRATASLLALVAAQLAWHVF